MDDRRPVQRNLRALSFSARPEHRQFVDGVRIAVSRDSRRHRGVYRAARSARDHYDNFGRALYAFRRDRRLAAHPGGGVLRCGRPFAGGGVPDDDAACEKARLGRTLAPRRGVCGHRAVAVAAGGGVAGGDPDQHRHHLCHAPGRGMKSEPNPILTLAWTVGLMSLFSVGGATASSGLSLALASDRTGVAALVTAASAVLAFATRLNPLWLLLAGGSLGFAGLIG